MTDPAPSTAIPASMLDQITPFPQKSSSQDAGSGPRPQKPPAMANAHQYNADEMFDILNRTPLFMTTLDETDGQGGENVELEAIRALAYEGTPAEIAGNFREQGNEMARSKHWLDARDYYTQALDAVRGKKDDGADIPLDNQHQVVDLEEEEAKLKAIEEASYVNRALCNLELKNYGSTTRDCAAALRLNPRNVKAYYRSAQACFALDKIKEAADAIVYCLTLDPSNVAAKTLQSKVSARQAHLEKLEAERTTKLEKQKQEAEAMQTALKARKYAVHISKTHTPDMEDARMALEDPLDPASVMNIPVLFLYPTAGQSDFIKAARETESLASHLEYILPCPWDADGEFGGSDGGKVDCFADTREGGMIKVGKSLMIAEVLGGGKAFVSDGMWKVYVVPRTKVPQWVEEAKKRKGK